MDTEENPPEEEKKGFWSMFPKTNVEDVGPFTVKPNDHWLIKGFKNVVNYTMFGFVTFMTVIIFLISFVAC